jgi:hypothetical protein
VTQEWPLLHDYIGNEVMHWSFRWMARYVNAAYILLWIMLMYAWPGMGLFTVAMLAVMWAVYGVYCLVSTVNAM